MLTGGILFASGRETVWCGSYFCERDDRSFTGMGKALMFGGAVVTLLGFIVLPIRMVARSRSAEAARANPFVAQRAAVSPWFAQRGSDGMSAGVSGLLRF